MIEEIYPRSFGDSNGDGVGDLNGITQHLDYLQTLGIDAIWIAPMYPSPQVDFGYDIADYERVDPQYGSLADFDALLRAAKKHHIRIILDMVLNHTSDRHAWFVESASSRDNPKADWYVWNDGVAAGAPGVTAFQKRFEHDGKVPPNNWESVFGGSAWEWVPARRQFYYHRFYRQQPDLNWRNPAVEHAMFGAMRFWLDRGVAGFRLDAISTLFEDPQLRNDPQRPGTNAQGDPNLSTRYSDNLPEVHDVIRRMRAMVDKYPGDRVLIGETYTADVADLDTWYGGSRRDELQLPMNMLPGFGWRAKFDAGWFRKTLEGAQTVPGQPLIVFDNHDNPRSIDRFGDGRHDVQRAKAIATLLLTSRATALTYYGAPLGMTTATPARKEDVRDPIGITGWPKEKGRDGERTPMQWTPGPQAGFSTNPRTWLPVNPNHVTVNVQTELAEPGSLLNWYRKLIALRRSNPALRDGDMTFLDRTDPDVLVYRRGGAHPVTVLVNFSGMPQKVKTGIVQRAVRTLAATDPALANTTTLDGATLPAYATWIVTPAK
ncbi:MAG TPA: alpha-glucosidase [Frateuria sp.]|uniref:alpha-glucosidase n=1 Tax=Frateuria sp. TaxID=2211372 RepID=UPI002DE245A4|nr:alpha-glucosidase [Frateuria sp.]